MARRDDSSDILTGLLAGEQVGEGLLVLPGQGNSLAIETRDGVVVLDASGYRHAADMIATLRGFTEAPVHAIVYSHGHLGYNAAIDVWQRHNEERGDPAPRLVAHENVLRRYRRYDETDALQRRMAAMQFPGREPAPLAALGAALRRHEPTETFRDRMTLVSGPRRVELLWAPSETDDALAVWLPDDGLLCGGAATPGLSLPNIGTPLRTQRYTIRWAETLERLARLGATRLLTEFGPLVEGDDVEAQLLGTAEALRWLRDEVVRRMNEGMDEAVRSAIIDPDAEIERARSLADAGHTQLALHVVDLLALGTGSEPAVVEARALKAELCRTRAREVDPFVSKSLYRSSASLLDRGHTSWRYLE